MITRNLVLAAMLLAGTAANAATTVTFDGFDLSGNFGGNGRPISTYSEGGFTLSAPAGQFVQSTNGANASSNSLLTGQGNTTQNALLTITGPAAFRFTSFDAIATVASSFTVTGYNGAAQAYTYTGAVPFSPSSSNFTTFTNLFAANIDRVTIATDSLAQLRLDNIVFNAAEVAAVPEPATWAMMLGGFGLVGATMRRRRAAQAFA